MPTIKSSVSINMAGISECSGSCKYCSAATTINYAMGVNKQQLSESLRRIDDKTYSQWQVDFNKLEEALDNDVRLKHLWNQGGELHVDLWGADPVTCHKATVDTFDFLTEYCNRRDTKLHMSSSTNGLPFARDEVFAWYIKNNVPIQYSHDGVGQWLRTGDVDPLFDDRIATATRELVHSGLLRMFNTVTSFYNGSLNDNIRFWMDYFNYIGFYPTNPLYQKMYIKINHVLASTYDLKQTNTQGRFGKNCYKELIGKPLGNMTHHNSRIVTGNTDLDHLMHHELDNYIDEYTQIAIALVNNDPVWRKPALIPFRSYFNEQIHRWKVQKCHDDATGLCNHYQSWKHQVGDKKYWKDFNFVIDTMGRYCECNLLDGSQSVKNPGTLRPQECDNCKYSLQSECHPCGSEPLEDVCEYRYRWIMLLRMVKEMERYANRTTSRR